MATLSTWAPEDAVLAAVAPLALAASVGCALVVDLDPEGPHYPSRSSLASMVAEGPRAADLTPEHDGVAVLRNGGIEADAAAEVLAAFATGWPAMVLRLPATPIPHSFRDVVPVRPLVPAGWLGEADRPAVYQRGPWKVLTDIDGIVVPPPRPGVVASLLAGHRPGGGRWLRAWRRAWEARWT